MGCVQLAEPLPTPMLSVEEARARILGAFAPLGHETIGLSDAWNRVLATDLRARLTQPPADVSAMDGYAVRAADAQAGARLRLVGAAPAGRPFDAVLKWGEAVRLFTGSVIPAGADAVLLQENATAEADTVRVDEAPRAGQHIRRQGQDFAGGDTVLPPGTRLGARQVGLAAAANHAWLTVYRRPRVAVLATGDEIHLPGDAIGAGGIVSSNAHMLAALFRAAGADPVVLPIAGDDAQAIGAAAQGAAGADLLVTTGGASVGDHDLVQAGLGRHGFALDFWKIAMRPGKPMIFGRLGAMPVIGLPGNPVSAFVCGVVFVLPAICRMCGLAEELPPTETASLGSGLRANDHRADFLRATLTRGPEGELVATACARQDSALQSVLAVAGALIPRPVRAPALEAGARVPIIRLDVLGF
jgi:molybdopterin molybdotransferase